MSAQEETLYVLVGDTLRNECRCCGEEFTVVVPRPGLILHRRCVHCYSKIQIICGLIGREQKGIQTWVLRYDE